jgi:hypothetical protein
MSTAPIREALLSIWKKSSSKIIRETTLDISPHFIPINLEALNVSLSKVIVQDLERLFPDSEERELAVQSGLDFSDRVINLRDLRDKIQKYVVAKHKNKIEISGNQLLVNGKPAAVGVDVILSQNLPAVVYSSGVLVGVLYSNYNSAYDGLFRDFLNKEIAKYIDDKLYDGQKYKKGFDVGHILGNSDLARTPLGLKINRMLDAISNITDADIGIPGYVSKNKGKLTQLYNKVSTRLQALQAKSTYGQQIEILLEKDFGLKEFLLSVRANVVVIQDRVENQKVFGSLIEGIAESDIKSFLIDANFSNSLVQELALRYSSAISGKRLGNQQKRSKKLQSVDIGKKSKYNKPTRKNNKIAVPTGLKSTGKPVSIIGNLQSLLDTLLVQKIKQNMGNGSRRDILNLRTGRFAESAKVERLSESRQGMITAFYSYMKNPYATFSAGGRQELPRSRDPKLLIAKSIREIVGQQVANRLRAVNI